MPSSYRRYAVDAQDDGKRDLWQDWGDVFASIANYFREYGWETGGAGDGRGGPRSGSDVHHRYAQSQAE